MISMEGFTNLERNVEFFITQDLSAESFLLFVEFSPLPLAFFFSPVDLRSAGIESVKLLRLKHSRVYRRSETLGIGLWTKAPLLVAKVQECSVSRATKSSASAVCRL